MGLSGGIAVRLMTAQIDMEYQAELKHGLKTHAEISHKTKETS